MMLVTQTKLLSYQAGWKLP